MVKKRNPLKDMRTSEQVKEAEAAIVEARGEDHLRALYEANDIDRDSPYVGEMLARLAVLNFERGKIAGALDGAPTRVPVTPSPTAAQVSELKENCYKTAARAQSPPRSAPTPTRAAISTPSIAAPTFAQPQLPAATSLAGACEAFLSIRADVNGPYAARVNAAKLRAEFFEKNRETLLTPSHAGRAKLLATFNAIGDMRQRAEFYEAHKAVLIGKK